MAERMTGAHILCEALTRAGADLVFGIPGGSIFPFYQALPDFEGRLRHVLCRHEQGAGHAAQGYARASGRVGVCVSTSGPGATNLVTPLADAFADSTPLVAISGQVAGTSLGEDAFQEVDMTGITMSITKHSYLVRRIEDIPAVVAEAFATAASGRPGPVLIDITRDAQSNTDLPDWTATKERPGKTTPPITSESAIRAAVDMLRSARRPLLLAGQGVLMAGASDELQRLAERIGAPVATTLLGIGAIPDGHALSLGMAGMHGWVHVNRAIQSCDLLLCIGARLDERVTGKVSEFAPNARIIQIDIDRSEIGRRVPVDLSLAGDARSILLSLLAHVPERDAAGWLAEIRAIQAETQHQQAYLDPNRHADLMPQDVYAALNRALQASRRSRVVTDVGQHQMWAAQLLDTQRPRSFITSGGIGTMGFGLPAAIGAALACPDEEIWVVCGDGGFQMTSQELATVMQEGITNLRIAIINNGYLGMVRQSQELFADRRYSGTLLSSPNFAQLAGAYGIRGETVCQAGEVAEVIAEARAHRGPMLIDFQVEREVNVFPMVPQDQSLSNMLIERASASRRSPLIEHLRSKRCEAVTRS